MGIKIPGSFCFYPWKCRVYNIVHPSLIVVSLRAERSLKRQATISVGLIELDRTSFLIFLVLQEVYGRITQYLSILTLSEKWDFIVFIRKYSLFSMLDSCHFQLAILKSLYLHCPLIAIITSSLYLFLRILMKNVLWKLIFSPEIHSSLSVHCRRTKTVKRRLVGDPWTLTFDLVWLDMWPFSDSRWWGLSLGT